MAFWGAVARFPVGVVLWHVDRFGGVQRPSVGKCAYCDKQRASGNGLFPPHDPSEGCEFKSMDPHCYCDACF